MRKNRVFYILGLAALPIALSSCSKELEVEPQNSYLTTEQIAEAGAKLPDRLSALRELPYADLKKAGRTGDGIEHYEYGYASFAIILGMRGSDMWERRTVDPIYGQDLILGTNVASNDKQLYIYQTLYSFISSANIVLRTATEGAKQSNMVRMRAEALAFRAFAYWNLAQLYQFKYKGNESAPCVPIVLEDTPASKLSENPRASVADVYKQIESDLNASEALFETLEGNVPQAYVSKFVVYGLKARMYLCMEEYAKAEEYAVKAKDGGTPYSLEEAGMPNFDDGTDHNMLWASIAGPKDRVTTTGIVNWQGMICSFTGQNSYSLSFPRCINPDFYNTIHKDDVRKNWWLLQKDYSAAGVTVKAHTKGWDNFVKATGTNLDDLVPSMAKRIKACLSNPFVNIKFAPVDKSVYIAENSADFPIMRVEEMHYIEAEAKGLGGDLAAGCQLLTNFVRTYRQPSYNFTTTKREAFIDEIYRQRRIEFWGEILPYYDMLRLEKPMTREGVLSRELYPADAKINLKAGDPRLIMQFPEKEVSQNIAVKQNESVEPPKANFEKLNNK